GFGERLLVPSLNDFSERYPDITLDLRLTDELSSPSRDDVDIAIRGGYAPNERIQAIRLMDNEFIPVAAPSYLKDKGSPKSAFELRTHAGIYFQTPSGPTPWLCEIDGEWHDVSAPAVTLSNNNAWLADQVLRGRGILMGPRWSLRRYLETGALVELNLTPRVRISQNPALAVFLLYQKQRYLVPKIKVAVDFLVTRFQRALPQETDRS
ncbi:MAG: substrate binding domain-containing protein, partial [Pseudomonadota bacterium]